MKKLIIFLALFSLVGIDSFGQETGLLSGTLRDQLTGDPLFGVKVTAGGFVTRTDEAGVYSLPLPPGSFDVRFNRYGLYTLDLPGLLISTGDTTMIDTTLRPFPVPVARVFGEIEAGSIYLTWDPSGPSIVEKSYDEGDVEEMFAYDESGNQVAVKFGPATDDHIVGGRIFVGDSTYHGPFLGTDFLVRVYDDEGMSGRPGNILEEDTVIADQYGWVGFDGLNAYSLSDNYYLSMYQLNDAPGCAPLGCTEYPLNGHSYMSFRDNGWQLFIHRNAMIRSWEAVPHDSLYPVSYRVARIINFDPNGNLLEGDFQELASTGNNYYDVNSVGAFYGIYAYAIKVLYNNGEYSPYVASNVIYHLAPFNVSVKINSSDSLWFVSANIKLKGQTPPFSNYPGVMQSPGTVGFNNVLEGKYQLEIYKPGYDKFMLDSIDISSDTTFEITLQDTPLPVDSLHVNPYSGLLEWKMPFVSQFYWECDTPGTCQSVITPELDLTTADHWTLSIYYFYSYWGDPAFLEYSTDHGQNWEILFQFLPNPTWENRDLDLTVFSGWEGESNIMFRIQDIHYPSEFFPDKIRVWTPDFKVKPQNYLISLNGEPAGSSDTTLYQLTSLENGKTYRAGVNAVYPSGLSDTVFIVFTCHELFPPENFTGYEENDTLYFKWSPPEGNWDTIALNRSYPDALTGYILHYESDNISLDFDFNDPFDTTFRMLKLNCDSNRVTISSVYDLSDYGYPGESFQSFPAGPLPFTVPGPILNEFFEDWSSMNYYKNCWSTEGQGMSLVTDQGNPGATFTFLSNEEPYQSFLTSYPLLIPQYPDRSLMLEFDISMVSYGLSGNETLEFQVFSESPSDWITVHGFSNLSGNIDWTHVSVNLAGIVESPLFRIRMKFAGNGSEMTYWRVDNIQVHNVCPGPESINAGKYDESHIVLIWNQLRQKADAKEFAHYNIYRDYNGSEYTLLAETADTVFYDTLTYGGNYCYRITALYDDQGVVCESPMSDSACITSFLGIPDNPTSSQVVCYPNPAEEYIIIKSEEDICLITIYNSLGMKMRAIENPGNSYKLDLNEIPSGIYLIIMEFRDKIYSTKFIRK